MSKIRGTTTRNQWISTIRDEYGQVVMVVGTEQTMTYDGSGYTETVWNTDGIQLVCGSVYIPSAANAKAAPAALAVCGVCRSPLSWFEKPRHGLCSREAGRHCCRCGRFLCPRHTVEVAGATYCKVHAQEQRIKQGLKSIVLRLFFKNEE